MCHGRMERWGCLLDTSSYCFILQGHVSTPVLSLSRVLQQNP